ncbi:Na+-translocating ferredoxin:NAD+ oxidoreductase RNF, RnfG subunit [Desulfuromusa kysingii]|uniref:Na+-translocating ferredoxin:NAD+ oxidoreductase RNF, RnfG subunit n=1 Tax=Desulfuromusa kysingii TaxID=37625 RepID=A0A1H4B0P9_9BACT|nr:FMN-binding protein [Desulfuromusa kysingii]SEA41472.1 Na+-translocating ferredoxin:NAD+ oxidoreductase RNF, RnfG subunit [Desulfuromusa kysingii]
MSKVIKKLKIILIIFATVITIFGLIYQGNTGEKNVLNDLKQIFPTAVSFVKDNARYPVYEVFNADKNNLGYAVEASSAGYAGPIKVLAGIDNSGLIVDVIVLNQVETPWFFQKVLADGFLSRVKGHTVDDPLSLNSDIDAVSGATYTSEGIVNAVRKSSHWFGRSHLNLTIHEEPETLIGIEELLLGLLYVIVFFSLWKKYHKLRLLVMGASLAFLGFWQNSPISFANIATLLTGNAPSYLERPFWYLLVVGTLFVTVLMGKNFYCYYLCPFGAIQEFLHKMGGMSYKPCPHTFKRLQKIRLGLTWLAFLLAIYLANPSISSYEPFSALFKLQGNSAQWLLMPFVLFIGIFISRFWCKVFCPVGLVMDFCAKIRKRVIQLWGNLKTAK